MNIFALDFLDTDDNEHYLFSQAVKEGIFKNDNIMIHVGQNFFNFIFTTLAWFTISQIYSSGLAGPPNLARNGKSVTFTEAADEVSFSSQ